MKTLEECDGDILDAVSLLELKGIINRTSAAYNTDRKSSADNSARYVNYSTGYEQNDHKSSTAGEFIRGLFRKSLEYNFNICKDEKNLLSLPVLAVIVLVICVFWLTVPALVIGLLAGCRYEIVQN